MSAIERWSRASTPRSFRRAASRSDAEWLVAEAVGAGRVQLTRIAAETDVQAARMAAIGHLGRRGAIEVAMLSQFEMTLALSCPSAAGRIGTLCEVASLALADTVLEAAQGLRGV
jgi:hypothetical protein